MASYLKSNVFSDVYIGGNCIVKGNISSLGGSITSQWTTAGSAIYYTTGNVGIGTNNPTGVNSAGSLLHIADSTSANPTVHVDASVGTGQARLHLRSGTGSTNRASRIDFFNNVTSSTVPQWTIISGYDQNGTNDMRYVNYAGAITMAWAQNGNIGIGTTNPGSLLTVSGGVGIGSGYQSTLAPTNGMIVQGGVGIGTTNPGVNALQVTGNVVTQGFTSNATNTVFNYDTLTVPFLNATQVGIGTTTNLASPLTIYNGLSTSTYTGTTAWGNLHLMPNGANNSWAGITFGGSSAGTIQQSTQASITVDSNSSIGTNMRFNVGYLFANGALERITILGQTGNVGIGTVNPQNTLHVSGGRTRFVAGGETYALGVSYSEASGGMYWIGATNSGTPDLVFSQGGGSERMRITNGGNVGIGTTSPSAKLSVAGDIYMGIDPASYQKFLFNCGNNLGRIQGVYNGGSTNPDGLANSDAYISVNYDQQTGVRDGAALGIAQVHLVAGNGTDGKINFRTSPSGSGTLTSIPSRMTITSSGVGIGTTNPIFGSGLTVNSGTINGSNAFNMVLLSNATTVNYTQVGQIGFGIGGDMPSFSIQSQTVNRDNGAGPYYDYGAQSDLRFLYKTFNTWPAGGVNEAMRIKGTNGYVGIGTNNPAYTLDIGQFGSSTYTLRLAAASTTAGTMGTSIRMMEANDTYGFSFQNLSASRLGIFRHSASSTGSEILTIMRDNPYVGIGVTSPGYTLDVSSDVNSGGSYRINGVLQPKIPSSLQGSWTAVSSVTITGIDLATAFYSAEIRLNWYKNGSAGNNGNVSFSFKDTGGNSLGLQEAYTYEWRPGGTTANTGSVGYLASGAEPAAPDYGSVIRVWSVRPGSGSRYHYTFESVGCYANIGATTNRGEGFVTVVSGTVNAIVISCSSGTFGGVYSVVQYI